jgi:hexosaminidase
MRKFLTVLPAIFIVTICNGQPVQLAPPLLKYTSVFFKDAATVELQFAQPGTQIHYTLDNQQPTAKDKIYTGPIQLKKSITTIKAITAGEGFLPSVMVSATFIKDGFKIRSIQQTPASERFPGNGVNTLVDNEGGLTDLNSKTWLGYQSDSVEINMQLDDKQKIAAVLIHCLQDHGSWVFLPELIRVYYFDEAKQSFRLIAEQINPAKEIKQGASCEPIIIALQKRVTAEKIKIVLRGVQSLPEGHPGKGKPGWLFIDEIKLY